MGLKNNRPSEDVGVKISRGNNPLYPPKKESIGKELLSAIATMVVCLFLVSVIAKNFNVYAIEQRKREKAEQNVSQEQYVSEDYFEDYAEENTDSEFEVPTNDGEQYTEESLVEYEFENEPQEYEEVTEESEYIFEDSSVRLISEEELWNLSQEELNYARNEIYARHGRRFKDEALQNYFDSKSWYIGTIDPDDFDHEWLNEIEKENANTILAYEKEMGYK